MIEEAVLQKVARRCVAQRRRLRRGVRRGPARIVGGARRRQGRGAHVRAATAAPASGSCVGDTTGFAHTADLTEAGLRAAAEAAAAAARGGGGGDPHRRRSTPATAPRAATTSRSCPSDVAKAAQGRAARRGPTTPPAPRAARSRQVSRQLRRQPPADPGRQHRRPARRRRPGAHAASRVQCVAVGDTGMQTGYESIGPHRRLRAVRHDRRRGARPRRRRAGRSPSCDARPAPSRHDAGRDQARQRRRAVPRGVRPRPRGRPRRARARRCSAGKVGEQVASPLVTLVDDGTMAGEWGTHRHRRRGPPAQRNVLIEDGVLTDYMWDFLRARKEGRASSRATAGARATSTCRWCA